jgi:hypothetical protein
MQLRQAAGSRTHLSITGRSANLLFHSVVILAGGHQHLLVVVAATDVLRQSFPFTLHAETITPMPPLVAGGVGEALSEKEVVYGSHC